MGRLDALRRSSRGDPTATVAVAGREVDVVGAAWTVSLGVLLVGPLVFGSFYVDLLTEALVLSMFAISVDLIWGYGGILTFGHAVFFGLGGYVMARVLEAQIPGVVHLLGLPLAAVVAGVAALAVAAPLFHRKITGEYFAIITLVLAVIAEQVAISFSGLTGGYSGLTGLPILELGGFELFGLPLYYVVLAATAGVYLFSKRVVAGSFGTAVVAIRENEKKARALGYDTTRYKTLLFAITGAVAGFSGALFTTYSGFVTPELLGFILSTEVLIWVLVGGRGTVIGAVVGTTFLALFENFMSDLFASWILLLGVVLVVIVVAFPGGLVGLARSALAARGRGE